MQMRLKNPKELKKKKKTQKFKNNKKWNNCNKITLTSKDNSVKENEMHEGEFRTQGKNESQKEDDAD